MQEQHRLPPTQTQDRHIDVRESMSDEGELPHDEGEGGWGSDSDGVLPVVPSLPRQPTQKAKQLQFPDNDFRAWIEDVAYQVGNAAHEIRNALRFWSSLVTPSVVEGAENKAAEELTERFKKADNKSGKLEAVMRGLVGRVRNHPKMRLQIILPNALELLSEIKAALAHLGESSDIAIGKQRNTIDKLMARQEAYLLALVTAHAEGNKPPTRPKDAAQDAPLPLPAPGTRLDFAHWGDLEEQLAAQMEHANVAQEPIDANRIIGLARLACNASHQLQNLAVAPRGGSGTMAHGFLKDLDNLAGKGENAARAIMVRSHRWHLTQKRGPAEKRIILTEVLLSVSSQGDALVAAVAAAEGGNKAPVEELRSTLRRLARLATILRGAELVRLPPPTERPALRKREAVQLALTRCAGCNFTVTGVAKMHCCKACEKQSGQHGGRCQRIPFDTKTT